MYIYFLRSGLRGPVKIGVAKNVDNRVASLQIGNPHELLLITKVKCKSRAHAFRLENELHKIFARKKIRGEWFRSDINLHYADRVFNSKEVEKANDAEKLDLELLVSSPL